MAKSNFTVAVVAAATVISLSAPAASMAGARPAPAIASLAPSGSGVFTATTTGRALSVLFVCDLDAVVCARATRVSPHTWVATLPGGDRAAHRMAAIGRAGSADHVWAAFGGEGP